jgi:hypothetical protein
MITTAAPVTKTPAPLALFEMAKTECVGCGAAVGRNCMYAWRMACGDTGKKKTCYSCIIQHQAECKKGCK